MTETLSGEAQVVHETLGAATLAPETEDGVIHGPATDLEANMPLLRELQLRLHSEFAHREFERDHLETAMLSLCSDPSGLGALRVADARKLRLGNGVVYETLIHQVQLYGVVHKLCEYRVILTAEQSAAAAAAAAQAEAQRAAARQTAAAKEATLLQTLKQFADVPEPGADLNGARELVKERRRMELRLSDRSMKISLYDAAETQCIEGLAGEHYVQPVKDHNEAYFRLMVKFRSPVKKSPSKCSSCSGKRFA